MHITTVSTKLYKMTKLSKSITYHFVWQIKSHPKYKVTNCGKIVNCQTMRELKKTVNGYTIGFNINGRFHSLKQLRHMLIKIEHIEMPF